MLHRLIDDESGAILLASETAPSKVVMPLTGGPALARYESSPPAKGSRFLRN